MENRVKRTEKCILCHKSYKTRAKGDPLYCNYCIKNVKVKKSINTKQCVNCKEDFDYQKRTAKYCSTKCANEYKLKSDKYSDFRRASVENTLLSVLWGARSRAKRKNIEFTLSDKDILDLLKRQNGKCAKTGIKLLASKQNGFKEKDPYTVSIDRIDNNKGYTLDNIELVCIIYNLFKSSFKEEDVINTCKEFIKYNNIKIDG